MTGIYFSGTGNTRHCIQAFLTAYGGGRAVAIEQLEAARALAEDDEILLGYPIYYSSIPKLVREFLSENSGLFAGKKVFLIATMGLFSGDGTGCAARLLRRYGAEIVGGLHLKMPDCIGDEKALKKSLEANRLLVKQAEAKLTNAAKALRKGHPSQEGLGVFSHIAGLLGQRLWFYSKTRYYAKKPVIDPNLCTGCGRCAASCPTKNLSIAGNKAIGNHKCTLCYRCFGLCPQKAITILGKRVYEQCRVERYISKEQ